MCDVCAFAFTRIGNLKLHKTTDAGSAQCRLNVLIKNAREAAAASTSSSSIIAAGPSKTSSSAVATGPSTSSTSAVAAGPSTSSSSAVVAGASTSSVVAGTSTSSSSSAAVAAENNMYCNVCNTNVQNWTIHLRTNKHKRNSSIPSGHGGGVREIQSAFRQRIQTLLFENLDIGELRAEVFLKTAKSALLPVLLELIETHTAIKFNLELYGEYIKMADGEISAIDVKNHQTKMQPSLASSNVERLFDEMSSTILAKMEEFQERDSGWTLVQLLHLEVNVNQYRPIAGSSFLPLPDALRKKKACVNVHNSDEYCFKWAIISSMVADPQPRTSAYNLDVRQDLININGVLLNFSGLKYPTPLKDLTLFERNNSNISVSVFGYDTMSNKVVGPYHIPTLEKPHHINLLLLQEGDKFHYVWIKNLSR